MFVSFCERMDRTKENLLNDALEVAQLAQTEEKENKLREAKEHYMEAVSLFIKVIQQETHTQRRERLQEETRAAEGIELQ